MCQLSSALLALDLRRARSEGDMILCTHDFSQSARPFHASARSWIRWRNMILPAG